MRDGTPLAYTAPKSWRNTPVSDIGWKIYSGRDSQGLRIDSKRRSGHGGVLRYPPVFVLSLLAGDYSRSLSKGRGDVIQVLDSTAPLLDPVPQLVDCPLAIPFVVVALTGANHFPVGSLQSPAVPSGFTDLDDALGSLCKDLKAGPGVVRTHCFGW